MRALLATTLLCFATLAACDHSGPLALNERHAASLSARDPLAAAEWSDPVHLDAPINSPSTELGPDLSPDELSLYFGSDRAGGVGGVDLWAVQRECVGCPWGTPFALNINSPQSDGGPSFSPDGHYLLFSSNRDGGHGGDDIWVSYRENVTDNLGWGAPFNLGSGVNTADAETGPVYVPALGPEGANLYLVRGAVPGGDIYRALVDLDAGTSGDALPVAELNSSAFELEPAIRHDGKEIFFGSGRGGSTDIWTATRQNVNDPWSTPTKVILGSSITPGNDLTPGLSHDGRTLLWTAGFRARGGLGKQDIWASTRHQGNE
jgi:WD40-like Beta Propeller Repeat